MVIPVSKIGWSSWVATPEKVEVPDTLSVLPRVVAPTASKVDDADKVVADTSVKVRPLIVPAFVIPPL